MKLNIFKKMILTEEHYNRMVELAREYGARKLILFGSTLDDPENARDIDLATDIPGWNIFTFGARIENEFNILVDVIPLTPSNPFTQSIEQNGKILYESV
jgi:hypothetical protein